ncbi:MAG: hypothetical protein LBL90_13360 [Prevotellaceae bacterium]|nr:hypothetical protein [Prevotellaceae bacterium]
MITSVVVGPDAPVRYPLKKEYIIRSCLNMVCFLDLIPLAYTLRASKVGSDFDYKRLLKKARK